MMHPTIFPILAIFIIGLFIIGAFIIYLDSRQQEKTRFEIDCKIENLLKQRNLKLECFSHYIKDVNIYYASRDEILYKVKAFKDGNRVCIKIFEVNKRYFNTLSLKKRREYIKKI